VEELRQTLALRPSDADAHTSLGNVLTQEGLISDAMAQYEAALPLDANAVLPRNNLAWILSASPDPAVRNGTRAVELAQQAVKYSEENDFRFLRTLGAAYAEAGRFDDAVATTERALRLAEAQNNGSGTRMLRKNIDSFRAHAPLRDSSLESRGSAR
jgi:Flp pilus assembly protein TadD